MDTGGVLKAALKCGDWILRNQINDRIDTNRGRGIRFYDIKTKEMALTGNWSTGIQCMVCTYSAKYVFLGSVLHSLAGVVAPTPTCFTEYVPWLGRFNKKFEDPNKTGEQVALIW